MIEDNDPHFNRIFYLRCISIRCREENNDGRNGFFCCHVSSCHVCYDDDINSCAGCVVCRGG